MAAAAHQTKGSPAKGGRPRRLPDPSLLYRQWEDEVRARGKDGAYGRVGARYGVSDEAVGKAIRAYRRETQQRPLPPLTPLSVTPLAEPELEPADEPVGPRLVEVLPFRSPLDDLVYRPAPGQLIAEANHRQAAEAAARERAGQDALLLATLLADEPAAAAPAPVAAPTNPPTNSEPELAWLDSNAFLLAVEAYKRQLIERGTTGPAGRDELEVGANVLLGTAAALVPATVALLWLHPMLGLVVLLPVAGILRLTAGAQRSLRDRERRRQ